MKRIGIVTLYGFINYGNRLQNYALNKVLVSNNYSVRNLCDTNRFDVIKKHIKILLLPVLSGQRKNNIRRLARFMEFQKNMKSECYSDEKNYDDYDFFITGSDQVWHPQWAAGDFYFLSFVRPEKRISYSASFGVSIISDDKKDEFRKHLSEMKTISVREESGAEIVKALTGRDVPVLVDPTLLLDKNEWKKISQKPKIEIKGKYILTYFLGEVSEERNAYIQQIADNNNLEIIRLEQYCRTEAWYKTGPAEFLWLIEHCFLMCTDSFHGSVFSILMEVPFLVFDRKDEFGDMSSRIDTLLTKFHLESHKFNNQSETTAFQKNYEHVHEILLVERKKALDYLNKALNYSN